MMINLRIRTRLLVAYVGILLMGFAALTFVAGQQISSASRVDYEQRLQNEIRLIAQVIYPHLEDDDYDTIDEVVQEYEGRIGGELVVYVFAENFSPYTRLPRDTPPEIENALRDDITVLARRNNQGIESLYTAAPIARDGVVHLTVPVANLQQLVRERWLTLVSIVGLVTLLALLAALTLSRSIIRPLYKLRESANRLSHGDFSHRVDYHANDEIGEVATAFNEMAHQVESMLEEQRAFASNTSHELRTPLTTIRLRSEALRYDDQLDAETSAQYIAEIDNEVLRLSALIEDLTLLSRLDAGRAELGEGEIDLGRFAASLKQQVNAPHIQMDLSSPDEPLIVCASLSHLTVVFRNILDNAIKFTPDGGHIYWRMWAEDGGVYAEIRDTGMGIEPEYLPHLFERFYRVDKSRSRSIPGTGLGLALVKSVLEAYRGSIHIESEGAGKGTTVRIFWPHHPTNVG